MTARGRALAILTVLAVRQLMTTAVSFDHRIVDGAYAARFLAHLRDLLEEPALLAAY